MREYTSRNGNRILYMSRDELEGLRGYKTSHGGLRARACCPEHNGDNPSALDIDYGKGWAGCYVCGDAFSIRVEDHPETYQPNSGPRITFGGNAPQRPPFSLGARETAKRPTADIPEQDTAALEAIRERTAHYRAAYPGSPAAEYARSRGIPDAIADRLQWGYAGEDLYLSRHRLFIPFTDPDGTITGGMGRALDSTTKPKSKNLRNADGFRTNPVNTAAIPAARSAGAPLVVVEGAFDAAACLAGGVVYVVALNGVTIRPERFAGVPRVFLAFDADEAGRAAVDRFKRTVPVHALTWEEDTPEELRGCKDVSQYWQEHRQLPTALRMVAADQMYPHLSDDQRTEALDLALEMMCDGWDTWKRDVERVLEDPDTSPDDVAMLRYALAVHAR